MTVLDAGACPNVTTVTTLASRLSHSRDLVAGGSSIYFKDAVVDVGAQGHVYNIERINKCTRDVETVLKVSPTFGFGSVAEHDGILYWGDWPAIRRRALTGGVPQTFSELNSTFTLNADTMYLTADSRQAALGVYALPVRGGVELVIPDATLDCVDANHIVATRLLSNGQYLPLVALKSGSALHALLPARAVPIDHPVSDDVYIYFRYLQTDVTPLLRVDINDGSIDAVTTTAWTWDAFAVDDAYVYGHDSRDLVRVRKTGGQPELVDTLALPSETLTDVLFDQDVMYFIINDVDYGGGSRIMMAPRPH